MRIMKSAVCFIILFKEMPGTSNHFLNSPSLHLWIFFGVLQFTDEIFIVIKNIRS